MPSLRWVKISYSKSLFLLSSRFFIVQITALIIYASENVLVANLFSPQEVIKYNISLTIFNAPTMLMTLCISPIWSSVTEAYAQNDFFYLKNTLKRLNYLSILFAFGTLTLLLISQPIYQFWLKGKVKIPFTMSAAMAGYAIVFLFQAPYSSFINGLGKMKLTTMLSLVGIIVYLGFAIFLSRYFNSSAGVIMGITISSLIGLFVQRIQVSKLLNKKAFGIWSV
jgi:O-antigen/teichoic acid export membrane protein